MRGKKKRAVVWMSTPSEKAYSYTEALVFAVLHLLAAGILLGAGVRMLAELGAEMLPETEKLPLLYGEAAVCALIYEFFLPMLENRFFRRRRWIRGGAVFIGFIFLVRTLLKVYWSAPLELEDGLLMIGNRYLELYNAYHHTAFSMDPGVTARIPHALTYVLAAVIFGFYNLTYLTRKNGFWAALPALVWAALLAAGCAPSFGTMLLSVLGFYLLASTEGEVRIGKSVDERGVPRRGNFSREIRRKLSAAALLAGGMLLISVAAERPVQSFVREGRFPVSVRESARRKMQGGKGSFLDFGFLSQSVRVTNEAPEYQDKKIMTVTVSEKPLDNLYFKDFEGARYQNGRWISQDSLLRAKCIQDDMEEKKIQRMLNEDFYRTVLQMQDRPLLLSSLPAVGVSEYRLKYQKITGANYAFPYFTDTSQMSDRDLTGDVLVKKHLLKNALTVSALNTNVFSYENFMYEFLGDLTGEETDWSWYDDYVWNKYRESGDFPGAEALAKRFGPVDRADKAVNYMRVHKALQVAAYLRGLTYSWNLDELEKGTDPVEYFLSKGKRGYCVHFASAGTLTLRKMGIPARYAEGYIVKRASFLENEDGTYTAEVIDRNRHAWTEIYLDHIGWIPVEMTAGYANTSALLQTSEEQEELRQQIQQSQNPPAEPDRETPPLQESTPPPEQEKNEETGGNETGTQQTAGEGLSWPGLSASEPGEGTGSWKTVCAGLIKLLAAVFAAGAFLWGTVGFIKSRIRAYYRVIDEEFARGSYVSMVNRINRRMIAGLRRTGKLRKRYPTDAEYAEALKKQFAEIPKQDWDAYMEIVKEAAFSAGALEKEKAQLCRDIYRRVRLIGKR